MSFSSFTKPETIISRGQTNKASSIDADALILEVSTTKMIRSVQTRNDTFWLKEGSVDCNAKTFTFLNL